MNTRTLKLIPTSSTAAMPHAATRRPPLRMVEGWMGHLPTPWPLRPTLPPLPSLPPAPTTASFSPVPLAAEPTQSGGPMPASDWNALFAAVVERLRAPAHSAMVLDCAASLELLQAALVQERAHHQATLQALGRGQVALVDARLELVQRREGERRAHHQAQHDSLTTLPNRRCFSARLQGELLAAADNVPSLAVLFVDLDGFKQVNDQHGHEVGDQMLRSVAERLRHSVRAGDMVGRLGGDEFACLLSAPMARGPLAHLARKLFDAVSAPLTIGALELQVRPSIGIALCPENGHTATTLLKRADAAMYTAKRDQSGYAFFDGMGAADGIGAVCGEGAVSAMGAVGAAAAAATAEA